MINNHIPLKKVRYFREQSNTTYLVHEVHILFFTTKQTSQPSHANDDNPPSAKHAPTTLSGKFHRAK
jgi:hypothetical protein